MSALRETGTNFDWDVLECFNIFVKESVVQAKNNSSMFSQMFWALHFYIKFLPTNNLFGNKCDDFEGSSRCDETIKDIEFDDPQSATMEQSKTEDSEFFELSVIGMK